MITALYLFCFLLSCTNTYTQFEPLKFSQTVLISASGVKKKIVNLKQFVFIKGPELNKHACYALATINGVEGDQLIVAIDDGKGTFQWVMFQQLPYGVSRVIALSTFDNHLAILVSEKRGFLFRNEGYSIYVLKGNTWSKLYTIPNTPDIIPISFSSYAKKIWINTLNAQTKQEIVFSIDLKKNTFLPTHFSAAHIAHNRPILWAIHRDPASAIDLQLIDLNDEINIPIDEPQQDLKALYITLKQLMPYDDELAYYITASNKLYSVELVKKSNESEEQIAQIIEVKIDSILSNNKAPLTFCGFFNQDLTIALDNTLYIKVPEQLNVTIKQKESKPFDEKKISGDVSTQNLDFTRSIISPEGHSSIPLTPFVGGKELQIHGEPITMHVEEKVVMPKNSNSDTKPIHTPQQGQSSSLTKPQPTYAPNRTTQSQQWSMKYFRSPHMQASLKFILGKDRYDYYFRPKSNNKPASQTPTSFQRFMNWFYNK